MYMGQAVITLKTSSQSSIPCVTPDGKPCLTLQNEPFLGSASTIWALVETEVAIICACLPTLRPLLPKKGWMGRMRSPRGIYGLVQRYPGRSESVAQDHLLARPPMITNLSKDRPYVRYEISRPPPTAGKGPHYQWPLADREDQYPLTSIP